MLAAETLIKQHLTTLPGLVGGVHSLAELDKTKVAGRRLPAIFVGCDGHRIEDARSHQAVRVAVRWLVVVAVRQVADVLGGSDAREAVSDIITAVMARLYRWQPSTFWQPMAPVDAPKPEYADGFLLYPLAFETYQIINKEG